MKKFIYSLICCLLACSILISCGKGKTDNTQNTSSLNSASESSKPIEKKKSVFDDNDYIQNVTLNWWQIYNQKGINTVTGIINNPNNFSVDITYDLVYYKNGTIIKRNSQLSNYSLKPNSDEILWSNADVPNKSESDEIKIENLYVTKTTSQPITGKIEYDKTAGKKAYYNISLDNQPALCTVWFLLYNDKNKNKKADKSEVVAVESATTQKQQDKVSFKTDAKSYTDCEIYYNAF